jgi:hypothetical protein
MTMQTCMTRCDFPRGTLGSFPDDIKDLNLIDMIDARWVLRKGMKGDY